MSAPFNSILIKAEAPKAWLEFNEFVYQNFNTFINSYQIDFEHIPFEFQVGVFKSYFDEQGMELDVSNLGNDELQKEIFSNFIIHEKVVSHYS